jgi:hypothetical protein
MKVVVTGQDQDGKAVEIRQESLWAKDFELMQGSAVEVVWGTESGAKVPVPSTEHPVAADPAAYLPKPGGTRFCIGSFPPDSIMEDPDFDAAGAFAEQAALLPEFLSKFDPDQPGMHTTDTIDYVVVLEGEIELETGDGADPIELSAGDVVVQGGVRHAWHNRSQGIARLAIVFVGAERR